MKDGIDKMLKIETCIFVILINLKVHIKGSKIHESISES